MAHGSHLNGLLAAMLFAVSLPAWGVVQGERLDEEAFAREAPWAVALVSIKTGNICTGVLIAPEWVLTAAHCTATNRRVHIGASEHEKGRSVAVVEAIRHPAYDQPTSQNDIGLLRLAEPVEGEFAELAASPSADDLARLTDLRIYGWGFTKARRDYAAFLHRALLRPLSARRVGSGVLLVDPGNGPCFGDSGGPLVIPSPEGPGRVIGVASGTEGNLCATGGGRFIYTIVDDFRAFIADTQARVAGGG